MYKHMTAEEIVRALRTCNRAKGHRCSECPIFSRYEHRICKATVDRFAANLIEFQAVEIAAGKEANDSCLAYIDSLKAQLTASQQETRAFEAATRRHYNDMTSQCFICYSCINHNARLNWDRKSEYACSGCGKGKPKWQFDIARFSSQGNKEEANGNGAARRRRGG